MGKSAAWVPCTHEWADVSTLDDNARGVDAYICTICDETREKPREQREGWRMVETNIDTIDGHVRVTVIDYESRRIVYSARYAPDIAREMAYNLTLKALELEDKS